jgi:ADP-ribose pyrophosphatase
MISDEPWAAPVTDRRIAHHGHVWDVVTESIDYNGETLVRDLIDHPGAVAVVALNEADEVMLIQQYRHPIRHRDWEIPAGLLDVDGEPPLLAAQRELAEEVDLVAADWAVLTDMATSPGGSNEMIRIFLARGLSGAPSVHDRGAEEADIVTRWVSLDEAAEAVLRRQVQNGPTMVGILAAHAARARGWETLAAADSPWPRHSAVRDERTAGR